ncbi:L-2,4-diaminobutyrate decarboxylase [Gracilibacillus orientalis]|uniref:L-2,4-diaminobutyrate decarboxylase n=1 Tax=Gracilibacillus orientalis TaxID=334253 RepID=A0A1I4JUD5_9BACI|nr:aspartate aminotransferase family protein [Gracilibacillus orientalis]SFL69726.1 L-2,4-diaminobutyrate decarboxylase [Gracilibacillus orientalis]
MATNAHVAPSEIAKNYDPYFLHESEESIALYQQLMQQTQMALVHNFSKSKKPYSGFSHRELKALLNKTFSETVPEKPRNMSELINDIGEVILKHSIAVTNPSCIAHLHCPPLSIALAAEVMISGTNQSMDSWDQSSAATVLEQKVIHWLSQMFLQTEQADGVFTSGGTQSNFMGLLLARDRYLYKQLNWNAQEQGLPPEANRLRIFCSKDAHFTVRQSAFLLGLGEQAVIPLETDHQHRICLSDLDHRLKEVKEENLLPFALVATAGTTDFGSIDPLNELANRVQAHQMWFHIDAAYGGALILSDRHKEKLNGIHLGDSITVDFHKLFYQPISCGAFLVKDQSNFNFIKLNADYLNPEDDEETGIPNLVTKSIQTTRRFDSLKLFMSLQALGRKTFADMIDYTIDLAHDTAGLIEQDIELELMNQPELNAIVFRYANHSYDENVVNKINTIIRSKLLSQGHAILARTRVNGCIYLKLTLLNPRTTLKDIQSILSQVKKIGYQCYQNGGV